MDSAPIGRFLRPAPVVTVGQFVLLAAWIASLTVGLDLVGELKLFDFMAMAGLLAFWRVISRGRLRSDPLLWWAVAFLAVAGWGTLVTVIRGPSFVRILAVSLRLFRLCGYVALFGIIRHLNLHARQLATLMYALLLAAVVQAVFIVLQQFEILPLFWPEKELYYGPTCGPSGTLGVNHINVVLFMGVGTCCVIALWRSAGGLSLLLRAWLLAALPVMAMAAVYGRARSSLLAIAALVLGAVRNVWGAGLVALAIALVSATSLRAFMESDSAYGSMFQKTVADKLDPEAGAADDLYGLDEGRPLIWKRTVAAMVRRPDVLLFGTGFQNFGLLGSAAAGHCLYLHTWVELGPIGLLVFIGWMRCLWRDLRAVERIPHRVPSALGHAGIMCLLTLLILGIFNETLYPQRSLPGFMGYALAFFGLISHRGWFAARRPA